MTVKRIATLLLALAMLMSMAACGLQPETAKKPDSSAQASRQEVTLPAESDADALSREDQELIAELIGGEQNPEDLSDEELTDLIDQLLQDAEEEERSEIVNLGSAQQEPVVDNAANQDAYDENGAMNTPFDQVYPELIEKEQVEFSDESLLIKLESDALTGGLKAAGVGALDVVVPMNGCAWYEARLVDGTDPQTALAAVRALDEVLLAEYNYEIQTAALDDYKHFDDKTDEEFQKNGHNKDQWHFHHCGIPDGYTEMDTEGGLPSVIVAVIDSGVDYDHEDLADNMWVNTAETPDNGVDDDGNGYIDDYYGIDLIAGQGSADDDNGHGTHVAGIIAAKNNNTGVVGIAYNVKIMPIKAAMHNGTLNQADIARAVLYAYEMGAEVINMSFGGTACSIAVQDALATAYTRCVLVASAGNSGKPNQESDSMPALPNYPAALTYVLGVMSVDENGVESSFTNWDTNAFNGIEYELYAPGENIMSTLPGDRYGFLSGTSMAAPVVSAMAAILRSEFSDRDLYPTKFIYGQLASTSEYYGECLNPELHKVNGGQHNLPQIVDLNAALTKLPKPELSVQDYTVFDDPALSDRNNGDGVIDAGETIALGLTLRNRWGMSENTLVTVDTLENGIADPYLEIVNPTVSYGSVGTYSTGDCGKIMTDGMHTGWENPFLLKIADDIPNDYRMTLHVTITCENALDADDETTYVFGEDSPIDIDLTARNGVILPSIIEEDMVLTKDNLYIIPDSTVITEGTTVRVEAGTHIQFWSDDPNDAYAESAIAYLLVNGKFLVEGTKEEPVYIYPSQLMDSYCVEMGQGSTGYISLKYADITNLAYGNKNNTGTRNHIGYAEDCTFRKNYGSIWYRYLSGAQVETAGTIGGWIGTIDQMKDCVFYKLGGYDGESTAAMELYGNAERCIFVECGLTFGDGSSNVFTAKDCVFLGNSYENPDYRDNHSASQIDIQKDGVAGLLYAKNGTYGFSMSCHYWQDTGTTYIRINSSLSTSWDNDLHELLQEVGGGYAIVETKEEMEWMLNHSLTGFRAGISYDRESETYLWSDGTPLAEFLFPVTELSKSSQPIYTIKNGKLCLDTSYQAVVYEIPGPILPDEITFAEYAVDMDLETTYQLNPMNTPIQLPLDNFIYESTDEKVVTVSETGLVTPVGTGTADVWVWSLDKAVKNRVTFTVRTYVPLEGIAFPEASTMVEIGTPVPASCVLTPADTTRRNVTYTSSDPSVISVENGKLVAHQVGTVTITASCEGMTATMKATGWKRTGMLLFTERDRVTYDRAHLRVDTPELIISEGATVDLVWTSSAPKYADVVDGKLMLYAAGSGKLTVKDTLTGMTDSVYFTVTETAPEIGTAILSAKLTDTSLSLPDYTMPAGAMAQPQWDVMDPAVAVLENGRIYIKGEGTTTLTLTDPRTGMTDTVSIYVTGEDTPAVKKFMNGGGWNLVLLEDGRLYRWKVGAQGLNNLSLPELLYEDVKAVDTYSDAILVVKNDNTLVYRTAPGSGSVGYAETLTAVQDLNIQDAVGHWTNMYGVYGVMFALTEDGEVYSWQGDGTNISNGLLGHGVDVKVTTPTKIAFNEPIKQVELNDAHSAVLYLAESGNLYVTGGTNLKAGEPVMIARNVTFLDESGRAFVTGGYVARFEGDYTEPSITESNVSGYTVLDLRDQYTANGVMTKDGVLYDSLDGRELFRVGTPITCGSYVETSNSSYYAITEEGFLFGNGNNAGSDGYYNALCGMSAYNGRIPDGEKVFIPIGQEQGNLNLLQTSLDENNVLHGDVLELQFNKQLLNAHVTLYENGTAMSVHQERDGNILSVSANVGLVEGASYKLVVSTLDTMGVGCTKLAESVELTFTYKAPEPEVPEDTTEETTPGDTTEPSAPEQTQPAEPVVYETIVDETILRVRTVDSFLEELVELQSKNQINSTFSGNAILNRVTTDTDVTHWFRPMAATITSGNYQEIALGGNWWGTTNEKLIEMQMVDYVDYKTYSRFMYAPYLTEAPENTFPFVTSVTLLNKAGETVTTVGNEEITFRVTFNRDMDTSIPLSFRFGSAYPYGDYEVEGSYVDARTWEGKYTLNTLVENGNQYITIENGCSATDDLALQLDRARFGFVIDTTAAQALLMQGHPTDTGIELTWTQDDFDTLMGYNVYRSTKEDGLYTRLNSTVIPAETMEWFDDTVEPGVVYYYNFTVVQTDLTESEPSGKISIMSKDTMAPDIYHTPVTSAFTGANLVITATVTDNLSIAYANLYYRVAGTDGWKTVRMNKLNDKYSAILPAADVTVEGIEYYIEAFDGVSYTYKGSAEAPYAVAVSPAVETSDLGDVDGDGAVTLRDAMVLLYAINDKYNMTAEEFARADLNGDGELMAAEALRILQYVNGTVGSLKLS